MSQESVHASVPSLNLTNIAIRSLLEECQGEIPKIRDLSVLAEMAHAIREIAANSVSLAGKIHVPVPDPGDSSVTDHVLVLTAVVAANVSAFCRRPRAAEDVEILYQIAESVRYFVDGVRSALPRLA